MTNSFGRQKQRQSKMKLAACSFAFVLAGSISVAACPTEPYLGEVCMTAANFCPRGYTPLVGQYEDVNEYSALFSLTGCQWGGNCRSTFQLPNMQGRTPIGVGQGIGLTDIDLGQWRGREYVRLALSQMPTHNHAAIAEGGATAELDVYDGLGTSPTPSVSENYLQAIGQNPFQPNTTANLYGAGTGSPVEIAGFEASGTVAVALGDTGGSQLVNVMDPTTALTYCIAMDGTYPPRS